MMIEPKLRFKADDGSDFPDWEEQKIEDVCVLNPRTEQLDDEFYYMDLGSIDHGRWEAPEIVNKVDAPSRAQRVAAIDDVFFQSVRPYNMGHYHYVAAKDKQVVASTGYIQARMRNGSNAFLYQLFYEERFNAEVNARCTGSNYPAINSRKFGEITVALPSLPEQRKIADLLSAVDDVIAAQEAEVAAWEKRKKGVMQKLFSQEVRFKADDGSDFPDWESTTVGELFTFVTEKNGSGRISDVITNSAEHGLIPQREYFDKDIAVEGNTEGYTVIHKGDFVYNPRKSTIAPFGPFNIYERDEVGIVSPLYTCLTPRDGETAPYLSWYFKTSRWHRYIVTHGAQGGARHDRVGMTNALMKGIPVMLPSLPEQRKIADCLTSLDDVIAKAKDGLDAWRELKKGLLQQMFV